MEKIKNFDTWLENYVSPEVVYYAIYDPESGEVTGIYPESAAVEKIYKVKIEKELAEDIINGIIRMNTCVVDPDSETVEIMERHGLRKIDDILHRIPDSKYNKIEDADIIVDYKSKSKKFTITLSRNLKSKRIMWVEETSAQFLITAYNDPHQVYETVLIKLDDLKEKPYSFVYKGPDERFSIFTRRLFKKYVYNEL